MKQDIKAVINERLKLQSTKRELYNNFGIANFNSKSVAFLYKALDDNKKNKLIITLGGRVNFKRTKTFLENIK